MPWSKNMELSNRGLDDMVDDTLTVNFANINPTKTNCNSRILPDKKDGQIAFNGDDICQYVLLVLH